MDIVFFSEICYNTFQYRGNFHFRKEDTMRYQTQGTCAAFIDIELKDGVIDSVKFTGGCNGNLQGISALVKGMTPEEAISKLKGIRCGFKSTSCPDQLARALESMV